MLYSWQMVPVAVIKCRFTMASIKQWQQFSTEHLLWQLFQRELYGFYSCTGSVHHRKSPHHCVTTALRRGHFQCSSQSLRRGWLIRFVIHWLWRKAYGTHHMWVGSHSSTPCYRCWAEMEELWERAVASKGCSEESDKLPDNKHPHKISTPWIWLQQPHCIYKHPYKNKHPYEKYTANGKWIC